MSYLDYPVYYPLAALVILTCLSVLRERPPSVPLIRLVTTLGIVGALALMYAKYVIPYDFKLFRIAGLDLGNGLNVYQPHAGADSQRPLNPPTTWPLFRLFACSSLRHSARIWSLLNALGSFALVPLAARALRAQDPSVSLPSRPVLGLLCAAVALSNATCSGLALGQLSLFCSVAILAALWAHGASHPWLAGGLLALATPKPPLLLPFLLLFCRRKDAPVWVSLTISSSALILVSAHTADLPSLLTNNLHLIARMSEPGQVNDYSYAGESHLSLIGFDHALYRLGLRHRAWIQTITWVMVFSLFLLIARKTHAKHLSQPSKCALIAIFTMLFLYHRVYDGVVLSLPLVFLFGQIQTKAPGRFRLALSASMLIASMYAFPELYRPLERWAIGHRPVGWLVEAVVLPSSTWLILGSLAACWLGLASSGPITRHESARSRSTALTRFANTSRPNRRAWVSPFSTHDAR